MKILNKLYKLFTNKKKETTPVLYSKITNFDNSDFKEQKFKKDVLFVVLFLSLLIILIFSYFYLKQISDYSNNGNNDELPPLKIIVPYPNNSMNIDDYEILKYTIQNGDSIFNILTKEIGISIDDTNLILSELKKVYNLSQLKVGQVITIKYRIIINKDSDGTIVDKVILEELRLGVDNNEKEIIISYNDNGTYSVAQNKVLLNKSYLKYKVRINDSLYNDGVDSGIPPSIMLDFIKMFSFDIDFQRDLRNGDTFEVVFESYYTDDGKKIKDGEILFASLDNQGRKYEMYRYDNVKGSNYFDSQGQSVQKSLLKTPINGARISSRFSSARKHPVLGYTRAHKGIDFAAPVGTPFYAAGSGTVTKVVKYCNVGDRRCNGGFGNYVAVKHTNNYTTEYAHISRVASNIKNGTKVKQGQVIAYVGNTGITTGPHLHYGVIYNGERINPDRVKSLPSIKLIGKDLINFNKEVERINLYRLNIPNQSLRLKK